ncbi:MAG: hypothetical protein IID13_08790 [Candidatus Marinimicrobia bacterium]|nr:hypothetical protein [Candidatus Neomarinimicrobiota bacterium]
MMPAEESVTLNEERIKEFLGAFPREFMQLGPQEQLLSAGIYRLLASKAAPVSLVELADSLEMTTDDVQEILAGWTGLYYDHADHIIGYWGLSIQGMGHRFIVDGNTLYTWCAWDSLFIPQIIGKTAQVQSVDPETKEIIQLTVSPERVVAVEPRNAVTSFMIPRADEMRSDVIKSFCHYLHFFTSQETAKKWVSASERKADLVILSLIEAYRIGVEKNRLQYGETIGAPVAGAVA